METSSDVRRRVIPLIHEPENQLLPDSLGEAYQCYRLQLRTFFELNSRETHAVDDLMQTLFLQMLKRRPGEEVRDTRLYLFRAAWNVLHNANKRVRRQRSRTVPWVAEEFEAHADRSNVLWLEDDASTATAQAELDRALAELPRACRVAVLRQYRDNMTYKEIAREMGVTTHAVKKYIVRALNHFRMHLNAMDLPRGPDGDRS